MQEKQTRGKWIWVIAVMALIFIHSAMSAEVSSEESGWIMDKLTSLLHLTTSPDNLTFLIRKSAHIIEYLVLGLCLRRALDSSLSAWLIGTGYAVTDEWHQYFVPGRSCELRDIGIDAAGVLAGVLLIVLIRHVKAVRNIKVTM